MNQELTFALDTETFPIETGSLLPKVVCASLGYRQEGDLRTELCGNDDLPSLEATLYDFFSHHRLIGANFAYDAGVLASAFPSLISRIFDAYADGRIHDVQIREKLKCLGTHGKLDTVTLPDGSTSKLDFSLAGREKHNTTGLVGKYLGRDRLSEKKSQSSWRVNYHLLDGKSVEEYPPEASKYAQDDAADTLEVFEHQVDAPNLETEWLHCAADFALKLMTAWGMPVDQEAVEEIDTQVETILGSGILDPLYKVGILLPAVPPQPYKRGVKNPDGTPKMKAAVPEKMKTEPLKLAVLDTCRELGIPVKLTDSGKKEAGSRYLSIEALTECIAKDAKAVKWIATDKKFLPELTPHSKILRLFDFRQRFQKVRTSVIPMLRGEERIYPNYDILKETGRTSSYGSNLKKERGTPGNLYPSLNIQQQPNPFEIVTPSGEEILLDPRRMYAPVPGRIFAAADYSSLELCSVAQQTYRLFGWSRHKELLDQGVDLHAYLGAQIAWRFHPEFKALAEAEGITEAMEAYDYFLKAKDHEDEAVRKFFKHYRTLAKPVGLGYPGGLGAATMTQLAWDTYGVEISLEDGKRFKQLWLETYPEMRKYFEWVSSQADGKNPFVGKTEDGEPIQGYAYTTPLGMERRGATFCAAANGYAMQSPSSEGAKIALFELARECYDPEMKSVLYGARPCAFIHDEIIMEIEDDDRAHARAIRLSEIMAEAMKMVMPDVPIEAEPLLMRRWSKAAKPVFVDGQLVPWDYEEVAA